MSNLNNLLTNSVLPIQLKEYLQSSESIKSKLNTKVIEEIEDLYIYFNALYIFDKSEFSANVIIALKRCKNLDTFYYYLKKVVETNLERESKDKMSRLRNETNFIKNREVAKTFRKVAVEYKDVIDKADSEVDIDILEIHKLDSKLELINQLIDHPDYKALSIQGKSLIKSLK